MSGEGGSHGVVKGGEMKPGRVETTESSESKSRSARRPALGRLIPLLMLGLLAVPSTAQETSPPEIVRIRIPAEQATNWFPAGTKLRMMTPQQFDELLAEFSGASSDSQEADAARLIRARHRAVWKDGVLLGVSELTVEPRPSGPSPLRLSPWTPMIRSSRNPRWTVGAFNTGEAIAWIEPAPSQREPVTITLEWELKSRPGSRGLSFTLGLPSDETASLMLDLPEGWIPTGPEGFREEPITDAKAARSLWTFRGRLGQIDLRLHDSSNERSPRDSANCWVEGPTRIVVAPHASGVADLANWTTEWTVQTAPQGPPRFTVQLDPDLELISIKGPEVQSYEAVGAPSDHRYAVNLSGRQGKASIVTFVAHARLPIDGKWSVPAMKPLDAIWTGGVTSLILDPSHVIQDCRERAGRRVPVTAATEGNGISLLFEASRPESVADLELRHPRSHASVEVRGRVVARGSSAEMECRLTRLPGSVADVPELEIEVELPPTWLPDRVRWAGSEEAITWSAHPQADGTTRVRVLLPTSESSSSVDSLFIGGSSTVKSPGSPLPLPRVRPLGVPVSDETWVVLADPTTNLTPVSAQGLAWIDPASVDATSPGWSPLPSPNLRGLLAWRWNSDQGYARVDREEMSSEPLAEVRYQAGLEPEKDRLVLDGSILVDGENQSIANLPLWIGGAGANLRDWKFLDATDRMALTPSPVAGTDRPGFGFPANGLAVTLPLPTTADGKGRRLQFHAELPWRQEGSIPILMPASRFFPRSTVLVEIPQRFRSRAEADGLRRVELAMAQRLADDWSTDDGETAAASPTPRRASRVAHAFTSTVAGGSLKLATEELTQQPGNAIVREANLITVVDPAEPSLNRLRMLVRLEQTQVMRFRMPPETSLVRARLNGALIAPIKDNDDLVLTLPAPAAGAANRSMTLDLDFTSPPIALAQGQPVSPRLPSFEIPCLSFTWRLMTPFGWAVGRPGPRLISADLRSETGWPFGVLGLSEWRFSSTAQRAGVLSPGAIQHLNQSLAGSPADDLSFAEWFARWDAGSTPLIVDRLALSALGYGPRSRSTPVRIDPRGSASASRTLQQYGLALIVRDAAILVTSQDEALRLETSDSLRAAINEALLWGGNRTDRFQTVTRWRGESTTRDTPLADSGAAVRDLPGWKSWQFSAASWPGVSAHVTIQREFAGFIMAWITAIGTSLGLLIFGRGRRFRLAVALGFMSAAMILYLILGPRLEAVASGLFLGSALALVYWLGKGVRFRSPPRPNPTSRVGIRLSHTLIRGTPAFLAAVLGSADHASAHRDDSHLIPVLFTFEGVFEPGMPAKQVILREDDYQRLSKTNQAEVKEKEDVSDAMLVEATHRISWKDAREVVLSSELTIRKTRPAPISWKIPIAGSREIKATLDDHPIPIFIEDQGKQAAIPIDGVGSFKLQLRRTAIATRQGTADQLDAAVNPLPTARLVIEHHQQPEDLLVPNARGKLKVEENETTVNLGPADSIVLSWGDSSDSGDQTITAAVEGLNLWDIEPAGDRLRARFTYRGTRRVSRLGFQMDPRLIIRSISIPGLVGGEWSGANDKAVWTARIDPPLQQGAILEFDVWRPIETAQATDDDPNDTAPTPETVRKVPRLEPLRIDRYTGLLGVRRPSHWTGRFEMIPGTDPLSDESFVKAWGTLPDDLLTLSGTTRLGRTDLPEFTTGPAVARVRSRPALELRFEPGRVNLLHEAELDDLSGPVHRLQVAIPENLEVIRVDSEGLTDWTRQSPDTLLLRYDRASSRSKKRLTISGWIPVKEDPLHAGAQARRIPTPWIQLPGMEDTPGVLTLISTSRVEVLGARGLTPIPSESPAAKPAVGSSDPVIRQTFRVENVSSLGELQWTAPQPRVNVTLESQMTIQADSAEWVAMLQYDVPGGALDAIRLKLSPPWASGAKIQLPGREYQLRSETLNGSTYWTITPDRPIWGRQTLFVRSSLSLSPGQEVQHPEITPLGRGVADTYLGLVDATASTLTTAGSSGLQPIAYSSRFRHKEFGQMPGFQTRAFHVERDNWSLKVQIPPATDGARGPAEESARVVSADVSLTVNQDRSVIGHAVYETRRRTGRFLVVELPARGKLLWTSVDLNPVTPLFSADQRWLIPLTEGGASRVRIDWSEAASPDPLETNGGAIALPRVGLERVPTLLTLRLPDDLVIRPSLAGLEPTTADRIDLERAERIFRQISELTTQMDRSSSRDRERIVSLTIAHEMAIRAAERSLQAGARTLDGARKERTEREIEALATNRKLLVESLRSAALDDELDSALAYLGLANAPAAKVPFSAPDSGNVETGRGLGRSVYLAGSSSGLNEEPTIITSTQADADLVASQNPSQARAMLILGILLPITLIVLARDLTGRWMTTLLGVILGTLGFMGGLAIAGAAAVVAFAGWLTRSRTGSPATPSNDPPLQIRLPQVTAATSTFQS